MYFSLILTTSKETAVVYYSICTTKTQKPGEILGLVN